MEELLRLHELSRYDFAAGEPEAMFDRLTELTALACAAPIALLAIVDVDRVWHKAAHGPLLIETGHERSFCADVVRGGSLLVVEDAVNDARFAGYSWVVSEPAIRFFAGAPLITPRGVALGALCVLDRQPRQLVSDEARALRLLSDQVMLMVEERRELIELRRAEGLRQEAVEALLATQADLQARIDLRTREVQGTRDRMGRILERVTDGFVALDRQWHYTYVNEQAARMLGRAPADLVGKHIWTEFPEAIGQSFHLAYERALREQVPVTLVDKLAPWDRWFENRIYPSPEGLTIFFTEITEQRRAQAELAATAERLAEAQAAARVGSWEWSVADNRVVWSDELFRIYGIGKAEFVGSYEGFLARVHPDDLERTKAIISDAHQHPKRFVYDHRIVRGDGGVRMLHTVGEAVTDQAGQLLRMVGSCWDTTEQWQTLQRLERAAAVVQALVAMAPHGILIVDERGRVQTINEPCARMFALPDHLAAPEAEAAPVLAHIAARLGDDGATVLARVDDARARPETTFVDRVHVVGGPPLECASRPFGEGAAVAGRIWTFTPAM
jgi:PAS domain S-box-containing protein